MSNLTIYFDGATEPRNPGGVSTYGWLIKAGIETLQAAHGVASKGGPKSTNNFAEYCALGFALRWLADSEWPVHSLVIRGDSQLVICQLTGEWQCRNERLIQLRERCYDLIAELTAVDDGNMPWHAEWIPREQNHEADSLSRKAYEEFTGRRFPERRRKAHA